MDQQAASAEVRRCSVRVADRYFEPNQLTQGASEREIVAPPKRQSAHRGIEGSVAARPQTSDHSRVVAAALRLRDNIVLCLSFSVANRYYSLESANYNSLGVFTTK